MVERKRFGSLDFIAPIIPLYESSASKIFASLPMRLNEWLSELEISAYLSSMETRQFIAGSLDKPVSKAKMCFEYSSKHSSIVLKPDFEPNTENQGVHICAGTKKQFGSAFKAIFKSSLESSPKIGRPSDFMFPRKLSCTFIFSATSIDGAKIRL